MGEKGWVPCPCRRATSSRSCGRAPQSTGRLQTRPAWAQSPQQPGPLRRWACRYFLPDLPDTRMIHIMLRVGGIGRSTRPCWRTWLHANQPHTWTARQVRCEGAIQPGYVAAPRPRVMAVGVLTGAARTKVWLSCRMRQVNVTRGVVRLVEWVVRRHHHPRRARPVDCRQVTPRK